MSSSAPLIRDNDAEWHHGQNEKRREPVHSAQAVIAIENARLLNELSESLEQQTATSEVLEVISSSPGELKPVFTTMLQNSLRICEAGIGNLFRYEDGARAKGAAQVP